MSNSLRPVALKRRRPSVAALCAVVGAAFLAGCDSPEKTANERFVGLSSRLTAAVATQDPLAKWEQLRAIDRDIGTLLAELGSTATAVKIASNEKIGPLTRAEIAREIEQAALSPAVCAKAPSTRCVLAVFEERAARALPDQKEADAVSVLAIRHLAGQLPKTDEPVRIHQGDGGALAMLSADLILAKKDAFFNFVERSLPPIRGRIGSPFAPGAVALLTRSFDGPTVTLLRRTVDGAPHDQKKSQQAALQKILAENLVRADDPALALVVQDLHADHLSNSISEDASKRLGNADLVVMLRRTPKDSTPSLPAWLKARLKPEELKAIAETVENASLRTALLQEFYAREADRMTAAEVLQFQAKLDRSSTPGRLKRAALARLKTDPAGAGALALALAQFDTGHPNTTVPNRLLGQYIGEFAAGTANEETVKRLLADVAFERVYPGDSLMFALSECHPSLVSKQMAVDALFIWADMMLIKHNSWETGDILFSSVFNGLKAGKSFDLGKDEVSALVARLIGKRYSESLVMSHSDAKSPLWAWLDRPTSDKLKAYVASELQKAPDRYWQVARNEVRTAVEAGKHEDAFKVLAMVNPDARARIVGSIAMGTALDDKTRAFRAEVLKRAPADFVQALYWTSRFPQEDVSLALVASRSAPSLHTELVRGIETKHVDNLWIARKSADLAAIVFAPKDYQPATVTQATYALLSLMAAEVAKTAN